MKIFLDRNKTLLPRVDKIYLITRIMVFISLLWVVFFSDFVDKGDILFNFILGTYLLLIGYFFLATTGKLDIKLAYLSTIIYDVILIPLLIILTGEIDSSYYLLFYLTVSVAAYILTYVMSFSVISLVTIGYIISIYSNIHYQEIFNVTVHISFLWIYYVALLYASEHMHKSEERLLKLLNTLNMRTSELEKYQVHLEMIFENSRVLTSILDADSIIFEVMRLLEKLLHYETFGVIFQDVRKNYYYRARHVNKKNNFKLKQIPPDDVSILNIVARQNFPVMIKDIATRDDYIPLNENAHSVMIVPMIAHGDFNGIIVAEANQKGFFKDKDLELLSLVARSAALALENAELHRKTEELTITDELTGAYNYRYFVLKLEEERRRAFRYKLPLSLIMVDIDWFKRLNDNFGHESGNLVLKKLSDIIKQCIRDVDIFARYGGEEFAIILPSTPQKDALVIGERIRKKVERAVFHSIKNEKLSVTVSIGLSSYPENGKSHDELVSLADQALYRAKGEGRNLVCTT